MKKTALTWAALVLVIFTSYAQQSLSRLVNPFIGTGGHGHTFPGACAPFGMVQLSPDTRLEGWDGCSGYHYSDSLIYGFSHTHLSGTGWQRLRGCDGDAAQVKIEKQNGCV